MPRWLEYIGQIPDTLLGALFFPQCPACDRETNKPFYCGTCPLLYPLEGPCCSICGDSMSADVIECGRCQKSKPYLSKIRSGLILTPEAKKYMHLVKYRSRWELLEIFRPFLYQYPFGFLSETVLIPVPLHIKKQRVRGFNQSEMIADWISTCSVTELLLNALKKTKETVSQSSLTKQKRQKNLKGAFEWNKVLTVPPHVTLIDDIYTTGATLEECAKALMGAGVLEVRAWTLFRTLRVT